MLFALNIMATDFMASLSREAYFRFSSKPFRVNRLGNSSHILNTQVQGNFEVSDSRDPRLPEDSMWDTSEFVDYLK